MTKQILKSILIGILSGIVLFLIPVFIIKIFLIFLLISAIFRIGGWGRYSKGWNHFAAYRYKYENISGANQPEWIVVPKNKAKMYPPANVKEIVIK